jgi:hypothetical protein
LKNYLTAGIGFRRLFQLARKNSVSCHPRYLLRFLFLLQSSIWTSIFSRIEHARYGKKIASTYIPEDPIFIIGHWRTGTTLLHQLLNLDPELAAPTLFQVAEPGCFICSYHYYQPVFASLIPAHRPMDNVSIGMNEPQEDEYAIYRLTDFSPIERLVFPKNTHYFITDYPSFLPENEDENKKWQEVVKNYFRKLHYFHGKTIVSKNPFNSLRIKELSIMFPKARFVHIVRHPYEVVPSAIHMWKIVLDQNMLNRKGSYPGIEEVTKGFDKILTAIKNDSGTLADENYFEMKFEDLETDPVGMVRDMYRRFHMTFNEALKTNILSYMDSLKNYRKNEFQLTVEEKELISRQLSHHMNIYNYQ